MDIFYRIKCPKLTIKKRFKNKTINYFSINGRLIKDLILCKRLKDLILCKRLKDLILRKRLKDLILCKRLKRLNIM